MALETEVSIVKDRSPSETALDVNPQRCWSEAGPGGRDLATSICHTQAQRSVCAFPKPPKGPSSAPGPESLAFDDLLPDSPFENGGSPTLPLAETNSGTAPRGSDLQEVGCHLGSEELRCVQDLWTQAALLANEQWNERSDESKLPRQVMHQLQCACEISALTGVDCLEVEPRVLSTVVPGQRKRWAITYSTFTARWVTGSSVR